MQTVPRAVLFTFHLTPIVHLVLLNFVMVLALYCGSLVAVVIDFYFLAFK